MERVRARIVRVGLALGTTIAAYLASPLVAAVAAEDEGLGSGGVGFALNFTFVMGVVLAFIFGFGIRDYLQRRALRARAAKRPAQAPPRA